MGYNKETGMYEGYIYKIWNDVNDKIYIGQTIVSVRERWNCHKHQAIYMEDNMVLYRAMRKYGVNLFHIDIVQTITKNNKELLIDEVNKMESYYIEKFNSIRPNGYNVAAGGESYNLNCQPIDQYDLKCNFIKTFCSCIDAAKELSIGVSSIRKCVAGLHQTAGGYVFVKHGNIPHYGKNKNRPVNRYTKDLKYIDTFNSIKDASLALNISDSNITHCCQKHKYKTAGGYVWFYSNDSEQPDKTKILNI